MSILVVASKTSLKNLKPLNSINTILFPALKFKQLVFEFKHENNYDWILFTSRQGVDFFFKLNTNIKLKNMKIAAIGTKTANHLKSFGFTPDFLPTIFSSQQFVKEFPKLSKYPVEKGVLYFTSELADNFLETNMKKKNVNFKRVNLYTTECAIGNNLPEFNGVVFASPSCVDCFKEKFGLTSLKNKTIVSIGTKTKDYLETLNIKSCVPKQFTLQDAVDLCGKLL